MAKTKILIILLSFVTISLSTTVSPLKAAFDNELNKLKSLLPESLLPVPDQNQTTCTCAVFLSDQFKKGSSEPPTGYPALLHEQDSMFPCTPFGSKQCTNKCLESVWMFFFLVDHFLKFFGNFFFIFMSFSTDCKTFTKFTEHFMRQSGQRCSQGTRIFIYSKLQRRLGQYKSISWSGVLL